MCGKQVPTVRKIYIKNKQRAIEVPDVSTDNVHDGFAVSPNLEFAILLANVVELDPLRNCYPWTLN